MVWEISQLFLCLPSFYIFHWTSEIHRIFYIHQVIFIIMCNIIPKCFVAPYQNVITCQFWSWRTFPFRSGLCHVVQMCTKQSHSCGKRETHDWREKVEMRKERVGVAGEEIFARGRNRDTWAALDARPYFIFAIILCLLKIIIIVFISMCCSRLTSY